MKLRSTSLLLILTASFVFSACGRTTVTSVWKKEGFSGPPMQKVMLLAQTGTAYNRSVWENIIAERLQRTGLNCVPAIHAFSVNRNVNPEQVLTYAGDNGIDGVLVVRHVTTRTEERYNPPQRNYYYRYYYPQQRAYHRKRPVPYRDYYYPHAGHYPEYIHGFYEEEIFVTPGYTSYYRVVQVESYLYSSGTREQVWSMTTQTVDPPSTNHLIVDVSRSIFSSLKKYGLVGTSR